MTVFSNSLSVQTHAFIQWKQTAEPWNKVIYNQSTDFVHVKHSSCCNSQFMLWVLAKKQIAVDFVVKGLAAMGIQMANAVLYDSKVT